MTTATAAAFSVLNEFTTDIEDAVAITFAHGASGSANDYVNDLGAIEGHDAWTWVCGADLAVWGAFRRQEYVTRDIALTLRAHENAVIADRGVAYIQSNAGLTPDRSAALAQRFDY